MKAQRVVVRTANVSLQLVIIARNGKQLTDIVVGLDGMESFRLAGYETPPTLVNALSLIATELRLDDKYGLAALIDGQVAAGRVTDRMGV
jgi:hypothetical protein